MAARKWNLDTKRESKIVIILNLKRTNERIDLEVPADITANDLVIALNKAYHLGIDLSDQKQCYLKTENPFALLKGSKRLSEFGIRNGTIINYTE